MYVQLAITITQNKVGIHMQLLERNMDDSRYLITIIIYSDGYLSFRRFWRELIELSYSRLNFTIFSYFTMSQLLHDF